MNSTSRQRSGVYNFCNIWKHYFGSLNTSKFALMVFLTIDNLTKGTITVDKLKTQTDITTSLRGNITET